MEFLLFIAMLIGLIGVLWQPLNLWYMRNRCPKCGEWHCLKFVTEIVTDKAVGHDRNRFGGGGGKYGRRNFGYGGFNNLGGSHTSDEPFIRYWVEERYICEKCGRHISIRTRKDKR